MGFQLVIFPGGIVRALAKTAQDYYASLQANASNIPFMHRIHDLTSLNPILGTPELLEHAKNMTKYALTR